MMKYWVFFVFALILTMPFTAPVSAQSCKKIRLKLQNQEAEPNQYAWITVTNSFTATPLSDQWFTIYHPKTMEKYNVQSGSTGQFKFQPKEIGEYIVRPKTNGWCEENFYVKKKLSVNWPEKSSFESGEAIIFHVPNDAGVKVKNMLGEIVYRPHGTITGFINFSLSQPGDFKLVVAESSKTYWGVEWGINVRDAFPKAKAIASTHSVSSTSTSISSTSTLTTIHQSTMPSTTSQPQTVDNDSVTDQSFFPSIGGWDWRVVLLISFVLFLMGLVLTGGWLAHRAYKSVNNSGDVVQNADLSAKYKKSNNRSGNGSVASSSKKPENRRGSPRKYRPGA